VQLSSRGLAYPHGCFPALPLTFGQYLQSGQNQPAFLFLTAFFFLDSDLSISISS
jgi:hypothetical protein